MLAVVWAVLKCRMYLMGLPKIALIVDHAPLLPFLNSYTLDQMSSPRMQRLCLKVAAYNLQASWRVGKAHCIPDALSRSPVNSADAMDADLDILVEGHHVQALHLAVDEFLVAAVDSPDPYVNFEQLRPCLLYTSDAADE